VQADIHQSTVAKAPDTALSDFHAAGILGQLALSFVGIVPTANELIQPYTTTGGTYLVRS
jgi:hypothetical protein